MNECCSGSAEYDGEGVVAVLHGLESRPAYVYAAPKSRRAEVVFEIIHLDDEAFAVRVHPEDWTGTFNWEVRR